MVEQAYGQLDRWRDNAQADLAAGHRLAERLERRAKGDAEVTARAAYLDLLEIQAGERVLEVGCGSGAVLRDVAGRLGPYGRAVGLDYSAALLAVARELAEQVGLADRIELREGDARALPFGDAEFDAVLAVTTLCHIPEAERAIDEIVRVTRPGGRVGVFARDTDSMIITHPDRPLTRRIVAANSDYASVEGWLGRRLPRLLTRAGLVDVRVRAFTTIEVGPSGFHATAAEWAADTAVQVNAISEDERQAWLTALHAEQEAGEFVASLTKLFVWGAKPT